MAVQNDLTIVKENPKNVKKEKVKNNFPPIPNKLIDRNSIKISMKEGRILDILAQFDASELKNKQNNKVFSCTLSPNDTLYVLSNIKIPKSILIVRDIVCERWSLLMEYIDTTSNSSQESNSSQDIKQKFFNDLIDIFVNKFYLLLSPHDFIKISQYFYSLKEDKFDTSNIIKLKEILCDNKNFNSEIVEILTKAKRIFGDLNDEQLKSINIIEEFEV